MGLLLPKLNISWHEKLEEGFGLYLLNEGFGITFFGMILIKNSITSSIAIAKLIQ